MNDKTRQEATEEKPQTQQAQDQEANEQEEDAVSLFDKITDEDSKDSEVKSDDDHKLDEDDDLDSETDDGQDNDKQVAAEQQASRGTTEQAADVTVDELRRQNEKLKHRADADSGRVSALTKKLNEARETIKRYEKSGDAKDLMSDDELKALEEDFPEAAKLARAFTERAMRQMREQLAPIHQAVDSTFERQQQDINKQQLDIVAEAHPDFIDIVAGNQKSQFEAWLGTQSQGVKALYGSDSAQDAIAVLDLYKQHSGIAASATPASKPAKVKDLSSHAELPRKGASRAGAESDDPVAIFNQIT